MPMPTTAASMILTQVSASFLPHFCDLELSAFCFLGHALGEGLVELVDVVAVVVVAVVLRTCPLAWKQEVGVRYADAVRIGVELTDETHDLLLVDFYVEHGVAHLSVGEGAGEAERKTVFAGDAEHELKQLETACLDAVERAHVVVKVRGGEAESLEAVYLSVE